MKVCIAHNRYRSNQLSGENIAVDTLTDEIEPYLLREQFLIRTPRGRVATVKAFQLLGKIPPKPKPDEKSLPTLFE